MALYAKMKGPVDYTVVGSPTIADGVMSDISNANYAYVTTNSTMYQSIVSFETAIKFTTGTSAPTGNLFGWQNGHGGAYINNSHRIRCVAIDFKEKKYRDYLTSFSALQANTTYIFKYEYKNNQGYCSLKKGDDAWQTETITTGTNTYNQPSNYKYFYGRNNQTSGYLTGGASIDFNNTYIRVNGQLWFGRDFDRVKLRTAPYVKYSLVGSPTITDGVASGFSASNYLYTNSAFNPSSANWSITLKIKTSSRSPSYTEYIFGSTNGSNRSLLIGTGVGKVLVWLSSNGTSWDIATDFGTYAVQSDTEYYINLSFNGSAYQIKCSTDGVNWQDGGTISSSTPIYNNSFLYIGASWDKDTRYLGQGGSIDLNNTYIKVNGQYWWHGAMSDNWDLYTGMKGPVGYTVVGSPTITDGVVSGFSSSNHLNLTDTFDPKKPYKIQAKFKFTSIPAEFGTLFGVSTSGIFNFGVTRGNSKLHLMVGNGIYDWNVVSLTGTTILQANTGYWAQAEFTGTQYILRISTDGVNWNEEAKITSSTVPNPGNPFTLQIGDGHTQHWYLNGSIDLKETYIKINNQLWFGKAIVRI